MNRSIRDIPKSKRGRPQAALPQRGYSVLVRIGNPLLARLDAWIAKQAVEMTRPEAIRTMIDRTAPP